MIVPSTRLFTAGEVETGAYLNSAVTNLGNFMLGKPIAQAITTSVLQSFSAGAAAPVQFASSPINRDNNWSSGANTRLTINTAGWYWLSGGLFWSNSAATVRGTFLTVTGTAVNGTNSVTSTASAYFQSTSNGFVYCNVGDYVELFGRSNGSATTPANPASVLGSGSSVTSYLTAIWVSS